MPLPDFDTGRWTPDNIGSASPFERATVQWLIANTLVNKLHAVDVMNASAVIDYENQFASYSRQRTERPEATNIVVPQPALKAIIVKDDNGYPEIGYGTELVCAVKTYQPPTLTPGASILQPVNSATGPTFLDPPAGLPLFQAYKRTNGEVFQRIG